MAEVIPLSQQSTERLEKLVRILRLDRHLVSRLAFAKGLMENKGNSITDSDSKGFKLPYSAFVKADEKLFSCLVVQKNNRSLDENEKRGFYKIYIENGLEQIEVEMGKEKELDYLVDLARNFVQDNTVHSNAINVEIGDIVGSKLPLSIFWNNHEHSQHFGFVGTTGAGKTQFVLDVLAQLYDQANSDLGLIFLDYAKGDVASNENFVKIVDAEVINLPNRFVPVNLFPNIVIESERNIAIESFIDIIDSIHHIGAKQRNLLSEAVQIAYKKGNPDFYTIRSIIESIYEERNIKPDTVTEVLRRLTDFSLFPKGISNLDNQAFFSKRLIIDLHKLESVRELTAYLILYQIYREASTMPDSEVNLKSRTRKMRSIVVIDEAHNYLRVKNKTLEKMLRVLRSKGIAVVLLSQSLNDFEQKDFDYSALLNWLFIMKSKISTKQHLAKVLGISLEKAGSLVPQISAFQTSESFGIVVDEIDGFAKEEVFHFMGKQFWQRYATK